MKKVIVHILNTVIILSLVVLALTLKTGGFSIPAISLSCHHIQNPLIIFVLFWIVRLILTRKQGTSAIESRRRSLRIGGGTRVVVNLIALLWLGSRIFPPHFESFSLYLPQARWMPHPLIMFALSSLLIAGIAYEMYTFVKRLLGETTALIAVTAFLFSPLCRTPEAGLFPSYTILLLLLGAAVHLSRYFARNAATGADPCGGKSRPLIAGLLFLLSALLFRYFWIGTSFKPQGLWEMALFKQRLTTAMPLPGNHLLWIVPGVLIFFSKRRSYLVVLLAATFLWTFFAADNNKLAAYLPMVCCLSVLMGACLGWLVENKLTNRTVFDRNISFAVAATFFVTTYGVARRITPGHPAEGDLWGYQAAMAGALISGIFDHFFFNINFTHLVTLFWLVMGLGVAAARLARVVGARGGTKQAKGRLNSSPWPGAEQAALARAGRPLPARPETGRSSTR